MRYVHQTNQESYLLRLFRGEDIIESLQKFCKHHNHIGSGRIQGIGAVSAAKIDFFNGIEYITNTFSENLELLSLTGNIAQDKIVHLHGVFGRSDGSCVGGHIMSGCIVSVTCEIQILVLDPQVTREEDPHTKLKLLNLPNEIK
ncbi:MAG: DNA-binding protein [Candidatus Heimdallarchaeota archaeon]|nr:MAG: DNA-binding protein [Candidatus Heimdallarchaeota archaeon]